MKQQLSVVSKDLILNQTIDVSPYLKSKIVDQGLPLMAVGMVVVFTSLVMLMLLMKGLKRVMSRMQPRRTADEPAVDSPDGVSGEVIAAIAVTLILEEEQSHDEESLVLTLHGLSKPYNSWWVKGMPETPQKVSGGYRQTISTTDSE